MRLTIQQKALLGMLAKGYTDKQIGVRFDITRQAVWQRIARLKANFGATTRAHLIHRAYATGALALRPAEVERVQLDPPEVIAARRRVLLGEED